MDETDSLSEHRLGQVRALIDAATLTDGVRPASDRTLGNLGSCAVTHVLATADNGDLAGYAQLDPDGSADLAVHPSYRRQGHGHEMLDDVLAHQPQARIWAHGDLRAARALAHSAGLEPVRSLWQMTRPPGSPSLPTPQLPEGVMIRTFDPGRDDGPWLAVNADAFADHPEQGSLTLEDLRALMSEPWFDPAGFFVAQRNGSMVGFHWTKVPEPGTGEIYVLGIHPDEQGTGLGRALSLIGLHHLHDSGVNDVMLYVEESNQSARALYESLGFAKTAADVQFARAIAG